MSVINATPLLAAAGGEYEISRSVRLRSSASAYFNRTPATTTSRTTWTWSAWVKRGALGGTMTLFGSSGANYDEFRIDGDKFRYFINGAVTADLMTSAVYRDPSAWYHIVLAVDTTQATSSNRIKMYVNGVQVTAFSTSTYPAQNTNGSINSNVSHSIGYSITNVALYFDGYLTEVNFIDGQALTPSSFGETDSITGVWKPKKYAGTYGTNGFYLNFSDNSNNTAATIGKDNSGNGNNWTPNNISVTAGVTYDSMIDVPTMYADGGNGRGNYAVLSPTVALSGRTTLSAGNLQTLGTSSSESGVEYGTIQVSSGKWYWENTVLALSTSASYPAFGAGRTLVNNSNGDAPAFESGGAAIFTTGAVYKESSLVTTASTYTTNDIIGIALDVDSLTCAFYKNGTLLTTVTGLTAGTYFATIGSYYNSSAAINFGQRPFAYTPPTGFKALNTQNLPDATIKKGNQFFDVSTWTGNGTSQSIVNSGAMQPDLVWAKQRSSTQWHRLIDAVRGTDKVLYSNDTTSEFTDNTQLTSFNSNGFSVGSQAGFNANAATYVGWQWKESASAGFDIVTYTGTLTTSGTVAISHSLGVAPKLVISKSRNNGGVDSGAWFAWTSALSTDSYLRLNTTAAAASVSGGGGGTMIAPTSSVFYTPYISGANISGATYVAYLFAEVAGFSKFGSFTGNGSADGPFIFTGFQPRFIMIKRTDTTSNWVIWDTARDTYNAGGLGLYPNLSAAEDDYRSSNPDDILSNGFKPRANYANVNASGGTYIYAAFASHPFKNSLAR